jgi:hypothetical protein
VFYFLGNQFLEYGDIVSTSNTYDEDNKKHFVEISTGNAILWSMGINDTED